MNNVYFCEKCRVSVGEPSELHFVEDDSDRGFCSEKCILEFYRPFMLGFEAEERAWREEIMLGIERPCQELLESEDYLQESLDNPDEVFVFETDTNQSFYTHLKELQINGELYFSILISSYIDGAPAFVFYRTLTQSQGLMSLYRRGELMSESSVVKSPEQDEVLATMTDEEIKLAEGILAEVESKKSQLLADMLEKRSETDIGFERFYDFDKYLEITLAEPDETYEFMDEEGDKLFTNIKSFSKNGESFFYIVLSLPYESKKGSTTAVQVPILGFPSNDQSLYPKYAQGKALNEKLRN